MRISFNSAVPVDYTCVGYGQASWNIYHSLLQLGHQVTLDDDRAPLQIHFKQPHLLKPVKGAYNISYFPWESTEFREFWLDTLNTDDVNEVWTTSRWCKKIFEDNGVDSPVSIYPHGITSQWKPKMRKRTGPLKYLIIDAEANRKGWQEAFDAFRAVFNDDPKKATLTIKTRQRCMARWLDQNRMVHSPGELPNVEINVSKLSDEEMVALVQDHDVLIYPSFGEGWGLIPFQMLATGGIAITTKEWCHYDDYLGEFGVDSSYIQSPWRGEHEGMVCKPTQYHLEQLVRKAYEEFEDHAPIHFARAFDLHEEYNWLTITENAFKEVLTKLG